MDPAVYDILRCLLDRVENLLQNPGSRVDPSNIHIPASTHITSSLEQQMGPRDSSDSRLNPPANQNELADLLGLRNDSPRITNQFPASVLAPQVNLMNELMASMRSVAPIIAASLPVLFDFVNRSSDTAQNNDQTAASTATRNAQGLIGRNVPRTEQPSRIIEQCCLPKQLDNMIRREATNCNNAGILGVEIVNEFLDLEHGLENIHSRLLKSKTGKPCLLCGTNDSVSWCYKREKFLCNKCANAPFRAAEDSNKKDGGNRDPKAKTQKISARRSSSKFRQSTNERISCQRCYRMRCSSWYRCYNLLLCKNCAPQMARKVFIRSRDRQTQDFNQHQRSSAVQPNRNSSTDREQQQNSHDDRICVICKINQSSRWQKFGELWICEKCMDLCTFSVMAQLANIHAAVGQQTSASLGAAQTNASNQNIAQAPTQATNPTFSDAPALTSNENPAPESSQHHHSTSNRRCDYCGTNQSSSWYTYGHLSICQECIGSVVPSNENLQESYDPHRRCNDSSCSKCSAKESTEWYSYGQFKFCQKCIGTIIPGSKLPPENARSTDVQTLQNEAARETPARNPENEFVGNAETQQANDELSCHLCAENITEGTPLHPGTEICEICYSLPAKAIEESLNTAPIAETSPKQSQVEPPHPANDSRLNQLIEMVHSGSIVPEPGIAESSSMYDSDGLCQCETCRKFKNETNQSAASSIGRQIDKSETVNPPIAVKEKAVTKSDKQERRNPNDSRFKHLNKRRFCCICKKITKTLRNRRGYLYYCQRCFELEQTTASGSITNPLAGSSFTAPVSQFIAVTRAEEDNIERFSDHQSAFSLEAPSIKTDDLENRKSTATIQTSDRLARESQERDDNKTAESKKPE
ncbi:hypothetical protein ACOME3_000604 [Neoechinorhynchus agilis]